jgi:hypothetical protein
VAVSLIAVIAFPAGLMLVNNARIYGSGRERISLQGTAQISMNGVHNMLLNSTGVYQAELGSVDADGFAEVRRLRLIQSGGAEEIIAVSDRNLELNGKPQAKGILLEVLPVDGSINDCRGLRLRITAYSVHQMGADIDRYTLANQVYFRNGE